MDDFFQIIFLGNTSLRINSINRDYTVVSFWECYFI